MLSKGALVSSNSSELPVGGILPILFRDTLHNVIVADNVLKLPIIDGAKELESSGVIG